jgi:hypothetical protein
MTVMSEKNTLTQSVPPAGARNASQVARALGMPRQMVAEWCRRHAGLALRHDGRWYLDEEKLADFLRKRAEGGTHAGR